LDFMLRLFRARISCLITAILLAAGTTTASFDEFLHAGDPHDQACAPSGDFGHDASKHRIGAAKASKDGSQHCVACHLARAPRLGAQPLVLAARSTEGRIPRPRRSIDRASAAHLSQLSGRSPPLA
jgi:hypothetical protein